MSFLMREVVITLHPNRLSSAIHELVTGKPLSTDMWVGQMRVRA
jgi:hypothetical protein